MKKQTEGDLKSILGEKKIKKIKAEEIYRDVVRKSLQSAKEKKSKFDKFLSFSNSNFGLFLYSSIVLSFVIGSYESCNEARIADRIRKVTISKLDTEISLRINEFTGLVIKEEENRFISDHIKDSENFNYGYDFSFYKYLKEDVNARGIDSLYKTHYYISIYPEYKDKGLITLISQLSDLEKDEDDQKSLKELKEVVKFLAYNEANLFSYNDKVDYCTNFLSHFMLFEEKVILDRWKRDWILNKKECKSHLCIEEWKSQINCK